MQALLLCDGTVLVGKKKGLQIDDFFSELCDLGSQGVVLRTEHLNLGLQVRKPLFLALPTLQRGNPIAVSA